MEQKKLISANYIKITPGPGNYGNNSSKVFRPKLAYTKQKKDIWL